MPSLYHARRYRQQRTLCATAVRRCVHARYGAHGEPRAASTHDSHSSVLACVCAHCTPVLALMTLATDMMGLCSWCHRRAGARSEHYCTVAQRPWAMECDKGAASWHVDTAANVCACAQFHPPQGYGNIHCNTRPADARRRWPVDRAVEPQLQRVLQPALLRADRGS